MVQVSEGEEIAKMSETFRENLEFDIDTATYFFPNSYSRYLEAVSSIRNLRTRHAVVIGTHNTWNNLNSVLNVSVHGIGLKKHTPWFNKGVSEMCPKVSVKCVIVPLQTDRLDTATCTHTLLSTDVHIRTDHVRYTLRYTSHENMTTFPHPLHQLTAGTRKG
ncbi:hypothetical protein ANN_16628 [Periplaneta americana]|uniref:Uncharacterized protein n=1 Tax=Periplaneta americana TaxID=6978 RepID=A0ABQ8SS93_PERAM|nr:hypothetical protein ANN_16628 [Periplaneta americana]